VYTAANAVEVGDEQRLYFCATTRSHGWYVDRNWKILEDRKKHLIEEGFSRIGFVRWKRDRLFGFRGDPEGAIEIDLGEIARPSELLLNFRAVRPGGTVRVGLSSGTGRSLKDAVAMSGDELAASAAWKDGTTIAPTPGHRVSARLHVDCAEVYAFELRPTA
jgi:hypothetical protein